MTPEDTGATDVTNVVTMSRGGGRDTQIAKIAKLREIVGEISDLLDICDTSIRDADLGVVISRRNNVVNQELFTKQSPLLCLSPRPRDSAFLRDHNG